MNMKKKSPDISPAATAKYDSRREIPYFCTPAATEAAELGGIALRAIISGIPKQKSTRDKHREPLETTKKTPDDE